MDQLLLALLLVAGGFLGVCIGNGSCGCSSVEKATDTVCVSSLSFFVFIANLSRVFLEVEVPVKL